MSGVSANEDPKRNKLWVDNRMLGVKPMTPKCAESAEESDWFGLIWLVWGLFFFLVGKRYP